MSQEDVLIATIQAGFQQQGEKVDENWRGAKKEFQFFSKAVNDINISLVGIKNDIANTSNAQVKTEKTTIKNSEDIVRLEKTVATTNNKVDTRTLICTGIFIITFMAFSSMVSWYAGQEKTIVSPEQVGTAVTAPITGAIINRPLMK
tara:strand:- start:49 stop:489 length:441 start_codon:yes stop_codon:yes gene_type:complete